MECRSSSTSTVSSKGRSARARRSSQERRPPASTASSHSRFRSSSTKRLAVGSAGSKRSNASMLAKTRLRAPARRPQPRAQPAVEQRGAGDLVAVDHRHHARRAGRTPRRRSSTRRAGRCPRARAAAPAWRCSPRRAAPLPASRPRPAPRARATGRPRRRARAAAAQPPRCSTADAPLPPPAAPATAPPRPTARFSPHRHSSPRHSASPLPAVYTGRHGRQSGEERRRSGAAAACRGAGAAPGSERLRSADHGWRISRGNAWRAARRSPRSPARRTAICPAELPGFYARMDATGPWTPVPVLVAAAPPGGPIEQAVFEGFLDEIGRGLAAALPLQGVYIASHGASSAVADEDSDGTLAALVRRIVGPAVPVVCSHDLHCNISERLVESVDAFVAYRTNPHVDMAARAAECADLLREALGGGARFARAFIRLPLAPPTVTLLTASGPYADLVRDAEALMRDDPRIANASVSGGFVYSDLPKCGITVTVTARERGPRGGARRGAASSRAAAGRSGSGTRGGASCPCRRRRTSRDAPGAASTRRSSSPTPATTPAAAGAAARPGSSGPARGRRRGRRARRVHRPGAGGGGARGGRGRALRRRCSTASNPNSPSASPRQRASWRCATGAASAGAARWPGAPSTSAPRRSWSWKARASASWSAACAGSCWSPGCWRCTASTSPPRAPWW